ncbi:hypothetical protein LXL04_002438 [Taraxacum kok-saghyz]
MTPIFLNSSSTNYSAYPNDFHHEDHLTNQYLSLNSPASSSLNSITTNMFLNSTHHDQNRIFDSELQCSPQHQHQGDIHGSQAYNYPTENSDEKGVQLFTWNKSESVNNMDNDQNQLKWMSSKMRVMLKMKKPDPVNLNTNYTWTSREETKIQDHKLPTLAVEETDNSSNSTSSNNNTPIRVCSDCYTTKTPLWRSGPRGPKSLCNACGIRQRKARRALAAAAAAAAENGNVSINQSIITPLKVKKPHHKDHKKQSNGYVTKFNKRKYTKHIATTIEIRPPSSPSSPSPSPSPSPSASPCSSSPPRKNCVEEFLVSLSKNLSFYRVFPQDEKEAAILLMALSCGYAHET